MAFSRAAAIVLVAGAAALAGAGGASAQGTIRVDLTPVTVAFAAPGIADFDAGWIDHPGVSVAVESRPASRAWELRLRALEPVMGPGKGIDQLLWRVDGSSVWTPMNTTDVMLLQGTGDQTVTVYFRMLLSWTADVPGSYSANLDFTAVRL